MMTLTNFVVDFLQQIWAVLDELWGHVDDTKLPPSTQMPQLRSKVNVIQQQSSPLS